MKSKIGQKRIISSLLLLTMIITSLSTSVNIILAETIDEGVNQPLVEEVEQELVEEVTKDIEEEEISEENTDGAEDSDDNKELEDSSGEIRETDELVEYLDPNIKYKNNIFGNTQANRGKIYISDVDQSYIPNDDSVITDQLNGKIRSKIKEIEESGLYNEEEEIIIDIIVDEDYKPAEMQVINNKIIQKDIILNFAGDKIISSENLETTGYVFKVISDGQYKTAMNFDGIQFGDKNKVHEGGLIQGDYIELTLNGVKVFNITNRKDMSRSAVFRLNKSSVKVTSNSIFEGNKLTRTDDYNPLDYEAGVFLLKNTDMLIKGSNIKFEDNTSELGVGLISIENGNLEIDSEGIVNSGILFENNKIIEDDGKSMIKFVDEEGNHKFSFNGKGIYFKDNKRSRNKGVGIVEFMGIRDSSEMNINVDELIFEGNEGAYGTSIGFSEGLLNIEKGNLEFLNNKGTCGAGIQLTEGTRLRVEKPVDIRFEGNKVNGKSAGAAMYIGGEDVKIELLQGNFEFIGNESSQNGGAIYIVHDLDIVNSSNLKMKFINNVAGQDGGAMFLDISTDNDFINLNIDELIFENNSSGRNGGAIASSVDFKFSDNSNILFKNNNAKILGGAIHLYSDVNIDKNIFFVNNLSGDSSRKENNAISYHRASVDKDPLINKKINIIIKDKKGKDIETIIINDFDEIEGKMKSINLNEDTKKALGRAEEIRFNTTGVYNPKTDKVISKSYFNDILGYMRNIYTTGEDNLANDIKCLFAKNNNLLREINSHDNQTGYLFIGDKEKTIDPVKPDPDTNGGSSSGGGGSTGRVESEYRFTFDANEGLVEGKNKIDLKVKKDSKVKEKQDLTRNGYKFIGWSLNKNKKELFDFNTPISKDITVYALWADESNTHISYINGYEDNTVRPEASVTRAETSAIIYRIMDDAKRSKMLSSEYKYNDDMYKWSKDYIATLSNGNIIKGYEDGSFRPNNTITRAEVAVMLSRYNSYTTGENTFEDVKGHWAEKEIGYVLKNSLIKGYEDGSFRPDEAITRAELVTIINRMLDRGVSKENIPTMDINKYFDLSTNAWYYEDIVEASNEHIFEKNIEKNSVRNNERWIMIEK